MDRLPALIVVGLASALLGCGDRTPPPAAARFEAVHGAARPEPAQWCDVWAVDGHTRLVLPAVAAAAAGAPPTTVAWDRWVWINVWATWCGPCRREMPLIERWVARLGEEGVGIDLVYLSVDDDPDTLARFVAATPAMAGRPSLRLREPGDLGAWLASLGGDADAAVPIQVIAAPGGRLRCVRTGSLREGDFPIVRAVLGR